MHVVFRYIRQIKVHDVWQLVDVDTAGGNIGGHQHAHLTLLEFSQHLGARGLALVAMYRTGLHTLTGQLLYELVGTMFGA